eukprot:729602-Pelagomonas_calceolata.AAC.1
MQVWACNEQWPGHETQWYCLGLCQLDTILKSVQACHDETSDVHKTPDQSTAPQPTCARRLHHVLFMHFMGGQLTSNVHKTPGLSTAPQPTRARLLYHVGLMGRQLVR